MPAKEGPSWLPRQEGDKLVSELEELGLPQNGGWIMTTLSQSWWHRLGAVCLQGEAVLQAFGAFSPSLAQQIV